MELPLTSVSSMPTVRHSPEERIDSDEDEDDLDRALALTLHGIISMNLALSECNDALL